MRKIIETTSTLILWAVFIVGSTFAVRDFFVFNSDTTELMQLHLNIVTWSPFYAALIFAGMLIVIRYSKFELVKKTIPCEHSIQWSAEELVAAQSGKVVDLHFPATGLACHVVTRDGAAEVLHSENQTVEVKVAMPAPSAESKWNWQEVAGRTIVILMAWIIT